MEIFVQLIEFSIAFLFGMAFGSYATMPYYRLPRGEGCAGRWVGIRSRCPSCDTKLRTRDLLPVFNWLLTLGKCHFCKTKISPMYFFIEFSALVLSLITYNQYSLFDLVAVQFYICTFGLGVSLIILMATDMDKFHVIPGQVLLVIITLGLTYRLLLDGSIHPMMQSVVFATIIALGTGRACEKISGKAIENYGYFKLYAIAGIWFTIPQLIIFTVLFLLFSIAVYIIQKIRRDSHTPLAIPLSAAYLSLALFPNFFATIW